jgi:hypothetical protein
MGDLRHLETAAFELKCPSGLANSGKNGISINLGTLIGQNDVDEQ